MGEGKRGIKSCYLYTIGGGEEGYKNSQQHVNDPLLQSGLAISIINRTIIYNICVSQSDLERLLADAEKRLAWLQSENEGIDSSDKVFRINLY